VIEKNYTKLNENSCKKIFQELRDKGLIAPSHKIEASTNLNYFAARGCTILINPEMNELDETSIRFSLLHEERHTRI
jgi:hypothetical protein